MKKVTMIAMMVMAFTASVYANQTCTTSSDGITICSNPDGSWGK